MTKRSEEARRVANEARRTSKTEQTLLVRKVPEEPQGAIPATYPIYLLWRRVDPEAKALVEKHWSDCSDKHGCATRKERFLPALKDGVSALENK